MCHDCHSAAAALLVLLLLHRVTFKLTDIDWPSCMDYVEFDYYDTVYNESVYMHTIRDRVESKHFIS